MYCGLPFCGVIAALCPDYSLAIRPSVKYRVRDRSCSVKQAEELKSLRRGEESNNTLNRDNTELLRDHEQWTANATGQGPQDRRRLKVCLFCSPRGLLPEWTIIVCRQNNPAGFSNAVYPRLAYKYNPCSVCFFFPPSLPLYTSIMSLSATLNTPSATVEQPLGLFVSPAPPPPSPC